MTVARIAAAAAGALLLATLAGCTATPPAPAAPAQQFDPLAVREQATRDAVGECPSHFLQLPEYSGTYDDVASIKLCSERVLGDVVIVSEQQLTDTRKVVSALRLPDVPNPQGFGDLVGHGTRPLMVTTQDGRKWRPRVPMDPFDGPRPQLSKAILGSKWVTLHAFTLLVAEYEKRRETERNTSG